MNDKSKYGRVLRFVSHYWLMFPVLFATLVVTRVASTLIDVAVPLASGAVVDAVIASSPDQPQAAYRALAWFIGLGAAFALARQLVAFLVNRMSARAMVAIGRDAFGKVQRFSADWHANAFAGSTVRKITRGMTAYDSFTDTVAFGLLPAFVVVVGVSVTFWWRWPLLGLIVAVAIVIFLVVTVALSVLYVRPANVASREWDSKMSGVLADSITGNQAVKSFAAEGREDRLFLDVARNWEWRAIRSWDRSAISGIVQSVMLVGLQIAMLGTGLRCGARGRRARAILRA
jgi:ATP-binding cassette subfamily B protein